MDLIYTNKDWEDEGVLKDYAFDLAFGSSENDFELVISDGNHCCVAGSLVYIEGTEYGGIVDGIRVITKEKEITYLGRTWHGVLASKIIEPDIGRDYLVVSGEANQVIGTLIERVGLSGLFEASSVNSGLTITLYPMHRYVDAYSGIKNMLKEVNGKLLFKFSHGKIVLSARPLVDYSADEQFDDDQVEMKLERKEKTVNHLICLGQGELAARQVVHLYADGRGNISTTQTFFDLNEIVTVYECSNAESLAELTSGGREKLAEYTAADKVEMNFDTESFIYDIGDIVGAKDNTTGLKAVREITKKIVTINNGHVNIEYKVGDTT